MFAFFIYTLMKKQSINIPKRILQAAIYIKEEIESKIKNVKIVFISFSLIFITVIKFQISNTF